MDQGLTWALSFSVMSTVLQCPRTLALHFPPGIYRSTGSSQVLPELVKSLDLPNVLAIQFITNGVVRVTYKESAQCDAAFTSGVSFRGAPLRITSVDSRTRLVYVRDLPVEVSDEGLKVYLRAFGVVHSVSMQTHPGMPQVSSGTRVVKVTLAKDLPSSARVSGFDGRFWYRGQPQACPVCRSYSHRVKDCPFNGLCRRCSQPGHMARECSSRRVSVATSPATASGATSSATVSGATSPAPVSGDDPLMSTADGEDQDYVYFSASESDVHSDEEEATDACSGDEEVLRSAAMVKDIASRMRKRALSESFIDHVQSAESSVSLPAPADSQLSLFSDAPESSVPVPPDPVPRSVHPPRKKKCVDLPPSGFSPQQVADALTRPYSGILPRTSYAYVCPDPVNLAVPVVMDFGSLTRSVVADSCTFELDRFVKYVHRKFSRVVASPNFASNVVVSAEPLPAGTPAKFPGQ